MQKINLAVGNLKINNLTQRKIAILGGTGSGKTTTLKLLGASIPGKVLIIDTLGVMRIDGFKRVLVNKINMNSGGELGKALSNSKDKDNERLIISFKGFLQDELSLFMDDFLKNYTLSDMVVLVDEIHEFNPETNVGGKYSFELERHIRHDRNHNVGFIFASQRPSFISKKVLGLADGMIIYRTTWKSDVKTIKDLISNLLTPDEVNKVVNTIQSKNFMEGYFLDYRGNDS